MKLKRKYRIKGLTRLQQEWLQRYEDNTMLEPLNLEELKRDPSLFNEVARDNIDHFEMWSTDAHLRISDNPPYNEES